MSDPVCLPSTTGCNPYSPAQAAGGTASPVRTQFPDTRTALDALKKSLADVGLTTRQEQGQKPTAWATYQPGGTSLLARYAHALKLDGPNQPQVDRSAGRALTFLSQLKNTPGLAMNQREALASAWLELCRPASIPFDLAYSGAGMKPWSAVSTTR